MKKIVLLIFIIFSIVSCSLDTNDTNRTLAVKTMRVWDTSGALILNLEVTYYYYEERGITIKNEEVQTYDPLLDIYNTYWEATFELYSTYNNFYEEYKIDNSIIGDIQETIKILGSS